MINDVDVQIDNFKTFPVGNRTHVEYHVMCRGVRFYTRCSSTFVSSIQEARQDFITHSNKLNYFGDR